MTGPRKLKFLIIVVCMSAAAHGETIWKAGFAQVKVTPEQPVQMAGYAARMKPFARVEADIFVKAMALEDSAGTRIVIVTGDIAGFRADAAKLICDSAKRQHGLERRQILLFASHSHAGPLLKLDQRNATDKKLREQSIAYTRWFIEQTVRAMGLAIKDLSPAKLSRGDGVALFVMNRRQVLDNGRIVLGNNPRGLVDRSVPVLRVDGADGKLRGVLFGTACHATTLGGRNLDLSGEYPGFAKDYIQKQHPQATAMFMAGCGGDANPYPRGTLENAKAHGASLGAEVCRVLKQKLMPINGKLNIAHERVDLPLAPPPSSEQLAKLAKSRGGWRPWVARQMQVILHERGSLPTKYTAPFTVLQFGDDLTLVALSGEVVVDYVPLLINRLGHRRLWIAAYCNDTFGYLPSTRVLKEGGYETRGLIHGSIGFFSDKAQDVVLDGITRLAKQAGRETN